MGVGTRLVRVSAPIGRSAPAWTNCRLPLHQKILELVRDAAEAWAERLVQWIKRLKALRGLPVCVEASGEVEIARTEAQALRIAAADLRWRSGYYHPA
jgi:hypothetical protein